MDELSCYKLDLRLTQVQPLSKINSIKFPKEVGAEWDRKVKVAKGEKGLLTTSHLRVLNSILSPELSTTGSPTFPFFNIV